jgi:uncharacterized protein (DUF2336 family)
MARPKQSLLVNFDALQEDSTKARRGELMRNVVALLGLASSERGLADLLRTYDSVLVKLADIVDPSVRAEAAARLADLRHVPSAILRKLARDDIEVSYPLLTRSPLLTEDDLIGIAEIRGHRHRHALASRPHIGERLVMVLAERGDDRVRRALAANPTAQITPGVFRRLLVQAHEDPEMQILIAEHPQTAHDVLAELVDFADPHARGVAACRAVSHPATTVLHERAMPVSRLFAGYDFEAADRRVRHRAARGGLDITKVAQYAEENHFGEAAIGLATLSGFPLQDVLRWFADCDAYAVLVVAKAMGAHEGDFSRILNAGPLRFRLSADERAAAISTFRGLDAEAAKGILAKRQQA